MFTGGTADNRIVLADLVEATGSPLQDLGDNVALLTDDPDGDGTHADQVLSLADATFADLSGATLILQNSRGAADNVAYAVMLRLGGDVAIGDEDDPRPRDLRYILGPADTSTTHTAADQDDVLANGAKIVCAGGARIIVAHAHSNSRFLGEPGARSPLRIRNNNSESIVRFTLLGGSFADGRGRHAIPSDLAAKGSSIVNYALTSDVAVRDVELYDDYLDFRPLSGWAAPTRAVFQSNSGIKLLGERSADLILFGSAEAAFEMVLGTGSGDYLLWGVYGRHGSRVVIFNLTGVDVETKMGLYSGSRGNALYVEHHAVLGVTVRDVAGAAVENVVVTLKTYRPTYEATKGSGSVADPTWTDSAVLTDTTDSDGEATLGTADGVAATAVVVEVLARSVTTRGGNVQRAYATAANSRVAYGRAPATEYGAFLFGYQLVASEEFTPEASGDGSGGLQGLEITVARETNLTAADAASVPASAATFDDIFDIVYSAALTLRQALPATVSSGVLDFGSLDINLVTDISGSVASATWDGSAIKVQCAATLEAGTTITRLETTGTLTVGSGVTLEGPVTDSSGTTGTIAVEGISADARFDLFAADGTKLGGRADTGTNADVNLALTPAQRTAGLRWSQCRAGYVAQAGTIDATSAPRIVLSLAPLAQRLLPDGTGMLTAGSVSDDVTTAYDFTDLDAVAQKIDIGDVQTRAPVIFAESEVASDDRAKFLAFGGQPVIVNLDPVTGDAVYLPPSGVQFRRAASGDTNAAVLATVFGASGTPLDSANGSVQLKIGTVLEDFARAIATDYDIDPDTVGRQSVAGRLNSIRGTVANVAQGLLSADIDTSAAGTQTYASLLIAIHSAVQNQGAALTAADVVAAIKGADFPAVAGQAERLGSLLAAIKTAAETAPTIPSFPTTTQIATAVVASVFGRAVEAGIDFETALRRVLAILGGVTEVADNGDGTHTVIYSRLDGAETTDWSVTVNDVFERISAGTP